MPRIASDRGRAGEPDPVTGNGAGNGTGAAGVCAPDGGADRLRDDGGPSGLAVLDLPVPAACGAVVAGPLAPGDDDARSPVKAGEPSARAPLGPGDDDPASLPSDGAGETRGPLAPGESHGIDLHDGFTFLAPPPVGPGGTDTGPRHLVRVPAK